MLYFAQDPWFRTFLSEKAVGASTLKAQGGGGGQKAVGRGGTQKVQATGP